ncbi:thiol:disulfide interchange protein [Acidithiobacillus marinus]|uniref:Thiol:disulfide interchange protein n=1 Tax=Acidithiobacillus marinus TaxID=187490 RepID=A0A2I1DQ42_9PROT|nr:thioredoxin fold domain-containing protein [Acidithiobacillus marinus]PKY11982.1 thiol:disulfide interchange protein [Acidithiobacillus marinus]
MFYKEKAWRYSVRIIVSLLGILLLQSAVSVAMASPAPSDEDLDYWQALAHTRYIQEGSKGPIVYDFYDPNCPYCHEIYTWLQNPIDSQQIRVRFITVGFLSPSSPGKAAAILAASDPLAALKLNENNFGTEDGPNGGISPASDAVQNKMRSALDFNASLLINKEAEVLGIQGASVPFLVFRTGGKTHYVAGLPDHKQWAEIIHAQ